MMFRFACLALLLAVLALPASAKVYELRYDFDLEATSVKHSPDWTTPDPYDGPFVGDSGRGTIELALQTYGPSDSATFDGIRRFWVPVSATLLGVRVSSFWDGYIPLFKPRSKQIDFYAADLDLLDVELNPRIGEGRGVFAWEYDGDSSWAEVEFTASNVSVTNLSQVPAPSALLLLGSAGAALFGAARRGARRRPA